jgi:xylulokinase
MHSDDLILAIDQGTSAAKVALFDLAGHLVASAGGETLVRHPRPTWMESDAESWWQVVAAGIRQVLATAGVRSEQVRAVGICGFMHTFVPVDSEGRALYPPMLWPDQRAAAETEALTAQADVFTRTVGRPPTTMLAAPRLAWLRTNHPEVLDAAVTFLVPKDILRFRLTGVFATDHYDASGTGLVDRSTHTWAGEVLDLVGVPSSKMPPILRCDDVGGAVTAAAAAETGLRIGTPVVVGAGDWFTTIVGSGCYLPERICFYMGTAGILGAFASADDYERLGATRHFGTVTATGSALRWARELLGESPGPEGADPYASLCAEAASSEPGARGLLFLPHLMGERGGSSRPHARGTFHGLTLAHRRADVVRAVLEGTALWLRSTTASWLRDAQFGDFVVSGGGARSKLWRSIFAAAFHRRLLVPEVVDTGALGAAMMAAVGTGLRGSYRELGAEWTRIVGVEEPDPALVDRYEEVYDSLQAVEVALLPLEERR